MKPKKITHRSFQSIGGRNPKAFRLEIFFDGATRNHWARCDKRIHSGSQGDGCFPVATVAANSDNPEVYSLRMNINGQTETWSVIPRSVAQPLILNTLNYNTNIDAGRDLVRGMVGVSEESGLQIPESLSLAPSMFVSCVAIVSDDNQKVLLAKRAEGSDFEGRWELPGGKRLSGEHPMSCAARETSEEGFICAVSDLVSHHLVMIDGKIISLAMYIAYSRENNDDAVGKTYPHHTEARWFDRDELMSISKEEMPPSGLAFVRSLLENVLD